MFSLLCRWSQLNRETDTAFRLTGVLRLFYVEIEGDLLTIRSGGKISRSSYLG